MLSSRPGTKIAAADVATSGEQVEPMPPASAAVGGVRRFFDIAVPRNIASDVNDSGPGAHVYNVDDLKEVLHKNFSCSPLVFEETTLLFLLFLDMLENTAVDVASWTLTSQTLHVVSEERWLSHPIACRQPSAFLSETLCCSRQGSTTASCTAADKLMYALYRWSIRTRRRGRRPAGRRR